MSTLPMHVWVIVLVGLSGTTATICVMLWRGALAAGRVHLSIDEPSSRFASFGGPRIAAVGAAPDAKLAAILRLVALPVPPELAQEN
ncbi:MAG TPA: hypothetical protein VN888_18135 [Mycobacterium sp.]|nr:hypothetical protein [Mycobacterium sp.]